MTRFQVVDPFAGPGIDNLFRGFFQPVRREGDAPLAIKVDVTENDKGYVIHAEIPGVRKEDIQVTIEANQVTIGAEVKRETERKDGERSLLHRALRRARSTAASRCRPTSTSRRARRSTRTACSSSSSRRRRSSPVASSRSSKPGSGRQRSGARPLTRLRLRRQRTRFAAYSSSMLSRKKLHGELAPAKRRQVSGGTPAYSKRAGVELDDQRARPLVVAGGPQVAAGQFLHLHRRLPPPVPTAGLSRRPSTRVNRPRRRARVYTRPHVATLRAARRPAHRRAPRDLRRDRGGARPRSTG